MAAATSLSMSDIDRQIEQLKNCETISGEFVTHLGLMLYDSPLTISDLLNWYPLPILISSTLPYYPSLRSHIEADVRVLCEKAREILMEESNVQRVDAPVTVCCKIAYFFLPSL